MLLWTFSTRKRTLYIPVSKSDPIKHAVLILPPYGRLNANNLDLQPNNILLGIEDESILSKFEQAELEEPVPRKTLPDRTVHLSRLLPLFYGTPVLCDFGEARIGTNQRQDDIMPDVYRAPEVILNMKWDYKVDIWNVGMVVRYLSVVALAL